MEFRFEVYDRVKVVNSGEQYTTHWEAYGKLMHGCTAGVWDNPFIVGAHLNDENLENTVFQILARDRIDTACGERNLYLITPQSDYDALTFREVDEKGEPAKIYVIGEDGLEEYFKMNVWLCEYKPVSGKIYTKPKCSEEDMRRMGFSFDTVDETGWETYYVHVKAIDNYDAETKAQKLFTEYFSKLWDRRAAETKKELQEISDNLYKVQHLNN